MALKTALFQLDEVSLGVIIKSMNSLNERTSCRLLVQQPVGSQWGPIVPGPNLLSIAELCELA